MQKGFVLCVTTKHSRPTTFTFFTIFEEAYRAEAAERNRDADCSEGRCVHISLREAVLADGRIYLTPQNEYFLVVDGVETIVEEPTGPEAEEADEDGTEQDANGGIDRRGDAESRGEGSSINLNQKCQHGFWDDVCPTCNWFNEE